MIPQHSPEGTGWLAVMVVLAAIPQTVLATTMVQARSTARATASVYRAPLGGSAGVADCLVWHPDLAQQGRGEGSLQATRQQVRPSTAPASGDSSLGATSLDLWIEVGRRKGGKGRGRLVLRLWPNTSCVLQPSIVALPQRLLDCKSMPNAAQPLLHLACSEPGLAAVCSLCAGALRLLLSSLQGAHRFRAAPLRHTRHVSDGRQVQSSCCRCQHTAACPSRLARLLHLTTLKGTLCVWHLLPAGTLLSGAATWQPTSSARQCRPARKLVRRSSSSHGRTACRCVHWLACC